MKRGPPPTRPPIVDAEDGAGLHILMLEAVTRPIMFRVRVRLPASTSGETPAHERILEVVARPVAP